MVRQTDFCAGRSQFALCGAWPSNTARSRRARQAGYTIVFIANISIIVVSVISMAMIMITSMQKNTVQHSRARPIAYFIVKQRAGQASYQIEIGRAPRSEHQRRRMGAAGIGADHGAARHSPDSRPQDTTSDHIRQRHSSSYEPRPNALSVFRPFAQTVLVTTSTHVWIGDFMQG